MRDLAYSVQYVDAYGHPIATIKLTTPVDADTQLQLAISDAGDKAFGDTWAKAYIRGLNLIVENSKALEPIKEGRQCSQVVQVLNKISTVREETK